MEWIRRLIQTCTRDLEDAKLNSRKSSFTVSTILNGRFNKNDVKLDRQIKAKLIYAHFCLGMVRQKFYPNLQINEKSRPLLVMLETKKEDIEKNPRIISNSKRAKFLKSKQTIKWMKKDGCEFEFENAIYNFFQVVFVFRKLFFFNVHSARKTIWDLWKRNFFRMKITSS